MCVLSYRNELPVGVLCLNFLGLLTFGWTKGMNGGLQFGGDDKDDNIT